MFELPQYREFKHIFMRIDSQFINNLNNDNINIYSNKLLESYMQCMNKLENIQENNGNKE